MAERTNTGYLYDLLHPNLVNIERFMSGEFVKERQKRPEAPCVAWEEMAEDWIVVRDIRGGTRGMRAAATRHLPRFPKERDDEYKARLNSSFLVDFLGDVIDELTSKPFARGISFGESKLPAWVEEFNKNVDGHGTSIHEFAKSILTEALWWGVVHCAVDSMDLKKELPANPVIGDFAGVKPRVRLVPGPNMLGWKRSAESGRPIEQVRFYERLVDDREVVEFLHIWDSEELIEMKRDYRAEQFKNSSTRDNRIGNLPIVTFYVNKTAEFQARPPFMDIADIQIDHWQSYSDQRWILHVARAPFLFRKGFNQNELRRASTSIGTRRIQSTENTEASMEYVEVSGSSVSVGEKHLEGLAAQAREKGAKPLYNRTSVTATGEFRADEKATCDLQAWCRALERCLMDVYRLLQRSVPGLEELPEDFKPSIHTDFDLRDRGTEALTGLRQDADKRRISNLALMKEVVRRGQLPEDFDHAADEIQIKKEIAAGAGDEDETEEPGVPGEPKAKPKEAEDEEE